MENNQFNRPGAVDSPVDPRNIQEPAPSFLSYFALPKSGGRKIPPEKITNQFRIGKCTAIANTQIVFDKTGILYSDDFQYMLQKKFVDTVEPWGNGWAEGSSIFSSLKVSAKYGYLRKDIFDKYFQTDPNENYQTYITRLKGIANSESLVQELLKQTEFPLQGYTQIPLSSVGLMNAIDDVANGVICRFTCGRSWFYKEIGGVTKTCWDGEAIEPINSPVATPTFPVTGHAISIPMYKEDGIYVGNTWGADWCGDGHANVNYMPTEAYKMYFTGFEDKWKLPVKKSEFKHNFTTQMGLGMYYRYEVELLQYALIFEDCMEWVPPTQRGYFGAKTVAGVRKFQKKYNILSTGYVGPKTLRQLNQLYS